MGRNASKNRARDGDARSRNLYLALLCVVSYCASMATTADRNEYMKNYLRERRIRIRSELTRRLGGKCVKCGSTEDLQFDHRDPKTKVIEINAIMNWSADKIDLELSKCQLLCGPCHTVKTVAEKGHRFAAGTHGTLSAYRYCGPPKCDLCKEAKRVFAENARGSVKRKSARGTHGTHAAYKYCESRCDPCRLAHNKHMAEYYRNVRAGR